MMKMIISVITVNSSALRRRQRDESAVLDFKPAYDELQ